MISNAADMLKALRGNKPQFAGVILYEGPSAIDGAPIVAIATRIVTKSNNDKTGAMVQTIIMRRDVNPIQAIKDGRDVSICGDCPQRPSNGGKCYVDVAKSIFSVYGAFTRNRYARPNVDYDPSILPQLFTGKAFRLGTYGDPAAIPFQIWRAATLNASKITGYSHQWRNPSFAAFKLLCMASCDNAQDYVDAVAMGWRTFRTKAQGANNIDAKEISCPASKEAGQRTSCDKCGLCAGTTTKSPRNIVIELHGFRVGKRKQLVAA
jgi:hypothetical protein